jgi:hypothetical protein
MSLSGKFGLEWSRSVDVAMRPAFEMLGASKARPEEGSPELKYKLEGSFLKGS